MFNHTNRDKDAHAQPCTYNQKITKISQSNKDHSHKNDKHIRK